MTRARLLSPSLRRTTIGGTWLDNTGKFAAHTPAPLEPGPGYARQGLSDLVHPRRGHTAVGCCGGKLPAWFQPKREPDRIPKPLSASWSVGTSSDSIRKFLPGFGCEAGFIPLVKLNLSEQFSVPKARPAPPHHLVALIEPLK